MDELNKSIEQVNQLASQVGAKTGTTLQRLDTIDANSLTENKTLIDPQIGTPTASVGLTAQTSAMVQNYHTNAEKEIEREQAQQESSKRGIKDIFSRLAGVAADKNEALESSGTNKLKMELDEIVSQMEAKDLAAQRKKEALAQKGIFGPSAQAEINRIDRENAREQADLAIVLSAKNRQYDTAYNIIHAAADAETEELKLALDAEKFFYTENKDALTKKEQRLFDLMITEDERAYTDAREFVKYKGELQLELAKKGAPMSLISQVSAAPDHNAAMVLAAPYLSEVSGGIEAPIIKTINGVDMQWNSQTGQWETPSTTGASPADAKITDQIRFLQETLAEAKALAGKKYAVGPSAITREAGDKLIGNTSFRQLETLTQTLQTNILTLAGDPAIRKFFGPQMSERDVQMMVSSGTTLNPQNNSKEQYIKEIDRLNTLLTKIGSAVSAQTTGGTLITAPDGTVIELID